IWSGAAVWLPRFRRGRPISPRGYLRYGSGLSGVQSVAGRSSVSPFGQAARRWRSGTTTADPSVQWRLRHTWAGSSSTPHSAHTFLLESIFLVGAARVSSGG